MDNNIDQESRHLNDKFFSRYVVLESTDASTPLSNLSPFEIHRALVEVGLFKNVTKLRDGCILVETLDSDLSRKLLNLSSLGDIQIKASAHRTLNYSRGVVRSRDLKLCTEEEIVQELSTHGVTKCVNITITDAQGQKRKSNTHILTFCTASPPKHVIVGYERLPVDLYIPNPLRCFRCQRYGHVGTKCSGTPACARCGSSNHDAGVCDSNAPRCVNCEGTHSADSKDCPKWQLEREVQKVKAEKGISFYEARRQLMNHPSHEHQTVTISNNACLTKYIVLESLVENKPLTSMSPFLLCKALQAAVGTLKNVNVCKMVPFLLRLTTKLTRRNFCN